MAFGRVYMGNTDGRVYSFVARTGQLAWATATGAYVYASAAVADVPGRRARPCTSGSYDGNFYAFNAAVRGDPVEAPASGGKISGSATIVDGVVYFSDLGAKKTAGLWMPAPAAGVLVPGRRFQRRRVRQRRAST